MNSVSLDSKQKWALIIVGLILALLVFGQLFKLLKNTFGVAGDVVGAAGDITSTAGAGIKKTANTIKNEINEPAKALLKLHPAFDPKWYKTKKGARLLTQASAKKLCEEIWDAKTGAVYLDTNRFRSIMKQLKSWSQISFLTEKFATMYGRDLLEFWSWPVSDGFRQEMLDLINGLPKT